MENKLKRLNFGCATIIPEDWDNVDYDDFGQTYIANALDGLPFEDNTYDYIVAHHAIACNSFHEMPKVISELKRVLKPGGVLRVSTSDLHKAYHALLTENRMWFPVNIEDAKSPGAAFSAYMTWYGTNQTVFTQEYANELFDDWSKFELSEHKKSHFSKNCPGITELDSREQESLYFEAQK